MRSAEYPHTDKAALHARFQAAQALGLKARYCVLVHVDHGFLMLKDADYGWSSTNWKEDGDRPFGSPPPSGCPVMPPSARLCTRAASGKVVIERNG
jgi:hypothetical protein